MIMMKMMTRLMTQRCINKQQGHGRPLHFRWTEGKAIMIIVVIMMTELQKMI